MASREVSFLITFEGDLSQLQEANQSVDELVQRSDAASVGLDAAGGSLSQVNRQASGLAGNLDTASSRLKAISKSAGALGSKLSVGLTTPLTLVGAGIVKTGMEFEAKMSEVKAISGATQEEFESLTKKAREMGMITKFSASESADALKYMSMAGWKSNQMMEALPGVMNLAAASGEDLGIVSDIVTDSMTAFGLQASESVHFADVLAKASSSSNTNVALLGETFKYVAPVAGALGYSVEDAAIGIGLMANAGIKGSQAGTALRSTLSRLADTGNKEVVSALSELGLSMTDSEGKIKPFKTLMDEMRVSFSNLSEAEQAAYATNIFGQEAMSGMLSIIRTSQEDYDKLTSGIYSADGAAKQMSDTMMQNLKGQITLVQSALQELGLQFYDVMAPSLSVGIQKIQQAVTWFSNLDESTKKTIVKTAVFLAALGPGLKIFSVFTGGLSHVVSGISLLTKGFSAMKALGFAGTLAKMKVGLVAFSSSALPVIAIIAGIVAVGYLLYKNWDLVKQKGMEFVSALREKFTSFLPAVQSIFNNLGVIFHFLAPIFAGALVGIAGIIGNFVVTLVGLVGNIITVFSGILNFIVGVFTINWAQAWEGIKQIFSGIFGGIKSIFTGVINTIISGINTVINAVNGIKLPSWIPGIGGKSANIKTIPKFAKGVSNFKGGAAIVGEEGPELVHLPRGSNVIPNRKTESIFQDAQNGKRSFALSDKKAMSQQAFSSEKLVNKNNRVLVFNPHIQVENNGSGGTMDEYKLKRTMRELFDEIVDEEYALI